MKTIIATLIGFIIFALGALAQTPTKAKKTVPSVSLDTILSCADDVYVQKVFKTDLGTMHKLSMFAMSLVKGKTDDGSIALRYAGFQSAAPLSRGDAMDVGVMPFGSNGEVINPAPFCSILDASYPKDGGDGSLPYMVRIEVDSDFWVFNPNELFLHADQFTFKSGVFTNSTHVFFSARKGNVEIRFVPKPDGLTLDSVFISKSEK